MIINSSFTNSKFYCNFLICKLTNQEIAVKLTISKRTVDNHVSNMFTKTGSKNRVALLNWAMDNGKICRDGFNCCSLPDSDQD